MDNVYWHAGEPFEQLFERIDTLGGWPIGKRFCIMRHGVSAIRSCYFNDTPICDCNNSILRSSDDYYWWKLSDAFKLNIKRITFNEFKEKVKKVFV